MTVQEQEAQDKAARDAGKLSRPIIAPVVTKITVLAKRVPLRIWLWIAVAVAAFFVGRIVLYEVRKDARNMAIAEVAEKHANEVRKVSEELGKKLDTALQTNADLQKKLDNSAQKATANRAATKATAEKKRIIVASHQTVAEVSKDVQEFLKIFPKSVTDTTLTFDVNDVRNIVLDSIQLQDLQLEVEFQKHMRGVAEQRVKILQDSVTYYEISRTADQVTIKALTDEAAAYKKAAKKSVWGKFVGGVKTVGIAVIPAAVVYLIMSGGK